MAISRKNNIPGGAKELAKHQAKQTRVYVRKNRNAEIAKEVEDCLGRGMTSSQVAMSLKHLGVSRAEAPKYIRACYAQWLYESNEVGATREERREQMRNTIARAVDLAIKGEGSLKGPDFKAGMEGLKILCALDGLLDMPANFDKPSDPAPVIQQLNHFYFGTPLPAVEATVIEATPEPLALPTVESKTKDPA